MLLTLSEQHLNTFLVRRDYLGAVQLAIQLDKPYQILKICKRIERGEQDLLVDLVERLSHEEVIPLTFPSSHTIDSRFTEISVELEHKCKIPLDFTIAFKCNFEAI